MSEGLRDYLLIGKFDVQVYGWLYNAVYRQYWCVQRVYNGVQSTTGTLPYISGKPVKALGYAECTPVHLKRLNFPYNSFQLCLDFSGTANYLAKLKKKMGTLLAAAPCPYPSAFLAQSPHFHFSDLELEALVVYESRAEDNSNAALGVGYG